MKGKRNLKEDEMFITVVDSLNSLALLYTDLDCVYANTLGFLALHWFYLNTQYDYCVVLRLDNCKALCMHLAKLT